MPTTADYMLLALHVYDASTANRIDIPLGWTELAWEKDKWNGFSAGAYMKGNDIVVAYTGTNDGRDMVSWTIGLPEMLNPAYMLTDWVAFGQIFDEQ